MTILTKTGDKKPEKKPLAVPELLLPSAPVSLKTIEKTFLEKNGSINKAYFEIQT